MENKTIISTKLDIDIELLERKLTKIENQLDRILTKLEKVKRMSEE